MRPGLGLREPLAAALLLALLPGCLYVGGRADLGPRLDQGIVATIRPGVTTKSELLALLGPPHEYKRSELWAALLDDRLRLDGALAAARRAEDVFTWQRDRLDLDGTLLLLFNLFDLETESDLLVVFFDERDVVRQVAFAQEIER